MNTPSTGLKVDAVSRQPFNAEGLSEPIAFERLLNDEQAAQLLGNMCPRTLQRLARTQVVPALKIGRSWFFRASTLDAWVNSQVQSQHRPCFSKEKE
jgi:Helix-turn-helix domain